MAAWTEHETDILRDVLPLEDLDGVMAALPGRNWSSIRHMAGHLGLTIYARLGDGRFRDVKGYIHVYAPEHPRAGKNGYVLEHILAWERANGRPVPSGCVVHHRDEVPWHNWPENLELMSRPGHARHHGERLLRDDDYHDRLSASARRHGERMKVLVDRDRFSELYLSGMPEDDIRAELGIGHGVYVRCLEEIFGDWRRPRTKKKASACAARPSIPGIDYDTFADVFAKCLAEAGMVGGVMPP